MRKTSVDGQLLIKKTLPQDIFSEGITMLGNNQILMLTWRQKVFYVFDSESLDEVQRGPFPLREAWGVAYDGTHLFVTDGSPKMHVLNPASMQVTGQVTITYQGKPVPKINDMEFVPAMRKIIANRWFDHRLAIIDPSSGVVEQWIDLSDVQFRARQEIQWLLASPENLSPPFVEAIVKRENCLNGVTYVTPDLRTGPLEKCHLLVTGKLWPKVYCVSLQSGDEDKSGRKEFEEVN